MANLGTTIHTFLFGSLVGEDETGNRYYTERKAMRYAATPHKGKARRFSRWVIYKGETEATAIPAQWHGWMHHTTDAVPSKGMGLNYSWQTESTPNATGSSEAYLPPGHTLKGNHATPTVSDYEAWNPNA